MRTSLGVSIAKSLLLAVFVAGVISTASATNAQAGWIGVVFQKWKFDVEKAKSVGLSKAGTYLQIRNVFPGSPAEAAGLKKGDIIWEYDGRRYSNNFKLADAIGKTPADKTVPIVVLRDWQFRTLPITLRQRPKQPRQAQYHATHCKDVNTEFYHGYISMQMARNQDDFLKAAKYFRTATEKQNGDRRCAAAYYNMGVALEKADRYRAAKTAYEKYIKYAHNPADIPAVQEKIAKIEAR